MSFILLKCRKCRYNIISNTKSQLLSGHNMKIDNSYFSDSFLQTDCLETKNSLYLSEDELPGWIVQVLNEASWLKGKLHCPNCSVRLGSFNFISGRKCTCRKVVLPPIHIIKSKIDWSISFDGS